MYKIGQIQRFGQGNYSMIKTSVSLKSPLGCSLHKQNTICSVFESIRIGTICLSILLVLMLL